MFSGWPRIWPLDELGVNKIRIPPKIQVGLSTIFLLTGIFVFAILQLVNPPRAYFRRCGALFCAEMALWTRKKEFL